MRKFLILTLAVASLATSCADRAEVTGIEPLDTTALSKSSGVQRIASAQADYFNPYDPVCNSLPPYRATVENYRNRKYGFCSQHCADRFNARPSLFLK